MTSNVSVIHARLLLLNTITYRSGRKQNATKLVEDQAQTGGAVTFGKESGVVFLAPELALFEQPHLLQVVSIHIPYRNVQNSATVCSRVGLVRLFIPEVTWGLARWLTFYNRNKTSKLHVVVHVHTLCVL